MTTPIWLAGSQVTAPIRGDCALEPSACTANRQPMTSPAYTFAGGPWLEYFQAEPDHVQYDQYRKAVACAGAANTGTATTAATAATPRCRRRFTFDGPPTRARHH